MVEIVPLSFPSVPSKRKAVKDRLVHELVPQSGNDALDKAVPVGLSGTMSCYSTPFYFDRRRINIVFNSVPLRLNIAGGGRVNGSGTAAPI